MIVGDFDVDNPSRDIIIETKGSGLKRINVNHPSYMALQYPLLFPYGEDGFMEHIPYCVRDSDNSIRRKSVTMREYYGYTLQQRPFEGKLLFISGKLFQQYIVDASTCIEENRIQWIRQNQKVLKSDIYKGLKDVIVAGDICVKTLGKRIVLPSSFTGSPRYMVQNFQDVMAICRWAGYPDLFITFTCNPKWPEIIYCLSRKPSQRVEDRLDTLQVFKIKLDALLKDLVSEKYFGSVLAGVTI